MNRRDAEEGPENQAERQERLLAGATGILMGREGDDASELRRRFGLNEVRRVETKIVEIAEQYRDDDRASRGSGRITDAAADLGRIVAACAELAAAFDEAGQDAYNVLQGIGPGGAHFANIAWASTYGRRYIPSGLGFDTLAAVASRYMVPIGPHHSSARTLADIHGAEPDKDEAIRHPKDIQDISSGYGPIHWPEAVAALGMIIDAHRQDFEERFRPEVYRLRGIRERGANGNLSPASGPIAETGTRSPGGSTGDTGGRQNLNDIMRGSPKWRLTRECWSILEELGEYWHCEDVSGSRSGRFFRFVVAVYNYAADEEIEEKVGADGRGTSAGLDRHVNAAVAIGPRLRRRAMFADRLTDRQREELGSLQQAWAVGRVPEWIEGKEAAIPQQVRTSPDGAGPIQATGRRPTGRRKRGRD